MLIISNKYESLRNICESKLSDDYEDFIADSINSLSKDGMYFANRPTRNTKFSDVHVKRSDGVTSWIEVKMDRRADLGSPRVYYSDYEGGWCTTYKTPAAAFAVDLLNSSDEAKQWIKNFKMWLCSELESSSDDRLAWTIYRHKNNGHYTPCDLKIILPTTSGGLSLKGAIPVDVIHKFASEHSRNILKHECDITGVVEDHYLEGKQEPAHYIQIEDDLFRIGDDNPFNWKVPKLSIPSGYIIVRISIRGDKLYEIQVDIKSNSHYSSSYSLSLGSNKMRPF